MWLNELDKSSTVQWTSCTIEGSGGRWLLAAAGSALIELLASRVLKNAEFWGALPPAMIVVRWRASFAVIYCGLGGAMVRGSIDVLDHGTS
jgi:hypothetical protein